MSTINVIRISMIILSSSISDTYGDNLLASLGFQTKLQTTITISFVVYWLGFIIFFATVAIIFYRFVQYEETVREFQMESSNKSIQLMHSIRRQMITLKCKRTLALRESAKTTFSQRGKLQKNIEAIEAERSSMPTQLLNHQRGIFPSSSNKSTHKKSSLSKSIMAIAPKSKKSLIESMIDDKSKFMKTLRSKEETKSKVLSEKDKCEKTQEEYRK